MNVTNLYLFSQEQTNLFRMVQKSADQTINNDDSLNNDADLKLLLEANSTYFIDAFLVFNSNAANDIKFAIATIAGATGYWGASYDTTPTVKSLGDTLSIGTDASNQFVWLHGIIKTVAAGTYQLMWAQNISGAGNTTLKAYSYIAFNKVA